MTYLPLYSPGHDAMQCERVGDCLAPLLGLEDVRRRSRAENTAYRATPGDIEWNQLPIVRAPRTEYFVSWRIRRCQTSTGLKTDGAYRVTVATILVGNLVVRLLIAATGGIIFPLIFSWER